jgi:hypothetical protein
MNTSVKYELEDLETLLSLDSTSNDHIAQRLPTEIDRIKKSLINEVFSFEDERHLERYIQYHQQAVIRLLDHYHTQSDGHIHTSLISRELEELLTFIERHFNKYFDQDAKAPEAYLVNVRRTMRMNAKKIFKDLSALNADNRLIEILLQTLAKIADRTSRGSISYRKVMYAKEVQKELLTLIDSKPDPANIGEELAKLIYYLNYNSTKALVYHAHLVHQVDKTSETNAEKIEKLSLLLKQINQAQVKPGIAYNPRASSVKDQINNYITEEIEYLERVASLNSQIVDRRETHTTFKVRMDISVAQLSYLIKTFLAAAIIQNNNVNELLRFFSKIIVTRKSEGISYDSLRAKFYNVEINTRSVVREMLTLMIRQIDKDI